MNIICAIIVGIMFISYIVACVNEDLTYVTTNVSLIICYCCMVFFLIIGIINI